MCVNNKARKIAWAVKKALHTGKNASEPKNEYVSAAIKISLSAGNADADLPSARSVWKRMSGACPVTGSHGNVLIAAEIPGETGLFIDYFPGFQGHPVRLF